MLAALFNCISEVVVTNVTLPNAMSLNSFKEEI